MPIKIHSLFDILALISELVQPADGCALANRAFLGGRAQGWNDDLVDMSTEFKWCDSAEILGCKISPYSKNNILVVKECISEVPLVF